MTDDSYQNAVQRLLPCLVPVHLHQPQNNPTGRTDSIPTVQTNAKKSKLILKQNCKALQMPNNHQHEWKEKMLLN